MAYLKDVWNIFKAELNITVAKNQFAQSWQKTDEEATLVFFFLYHCILIGIILNGLTDTF